jgi:hypothetical protein
MENQGPTLPTINTCCASQMFETTNAADSALSPSVATIFTVLDNIHLLRCVLMYLDISALTGFYVAAARRTPVEFCKAITVMHTGYYTPIPVIGPTNEEYFGELFNVRHAFAPSVIRHLRTLVLIARDGGASSLPFSPLSFSSVHKFMRKIGNEINDEGCLLQIEVLAFDMADDANTPLLEKITISKQIVTLVRHQIIHRYCRNLKYLFLESSYTGVFDGESALEGVRVACPKLERLDLWIPLTVDDFMYFTDGNTVWPNLISLNLGRLISAFVKRLELDHYFEGSQMSDCEQRVCCAIAAVLTKHKFPRLTKLEIYSNQNAVFNFIHALIQRWIVDKDTSVDSLKYRTHSGYRNFSSPFHDLILANVPHPEHIPSHYVINGVFDDPVNDEFIPLDSIKRNDDFDYHADMDVFVGQQLNSLHVCCFQLAAFDVNLFQHWTNVLDGVLTSKGPEGCCLFPNLKDVLFQPDLPHPQVMLLVNCGGSIPHPLTLRVHGKLGQFLNAFLDQTFQANLWKLRSVEHGVQFNCPIAVRRKAMLRQIGGIGNSHWRSFDNELSINCFWSYLHRQQFNQNTEQYYLEEFQQSALYLCNALRKSNLENIEMFSLPMSLAHHWKNALVSQDASVNCTGRLGSLRSLTLALDLLWSKDALNTVASFLLHIVIKRDLTPNLTCLQLHVFSCQTWQQVISMDPMDDQSQNGLLFVILAMLHADRNILTTVRYEGRTFTFFAQN